MNCGSKFKTASGIEIAYELMGRSDPARTGDLVFFNGLLAGTPSWAFQYRNKKLLDKFRLVFFDYRCQGGSSTVSDPFVLEDIVQDGKELLLSLELLRASYIGHSFGGSLARVMADGSTEMFGPDRVKSIVLVNTGEKFVHSTKSIFRSFAKVFRGLAERDDSPQNRLLVRDVFGMFPPLLFGSEYLKKLKGLEHEAVSSYIKYNGSLSGLSALLEAVLGREETESDARGPLFRNHALIFGASEDRITPLEQSLLLRSKMPNSRMVTVTGTGHVVMLEQRKLFTDSLEGFLSEVYSLGWPTVTPWKGSGP